ncbi:hypothetical protein SAY87_015300 [Trapa incisa]|uniref:START domain-containing protein n=1 Tax=Trapa incisa TaxID=236973 RepID=A0AAN7GU03_9MYRT|nr:hypothetical protein SAY87_015300 [Trapa incisa]
MALMSLISDILRRPTIAGVLGGLVTLMAPVWIAVVVGVLVGWAWKPKWANFGKELLNGSNESSSASTALASSIPSFNTLKLQLPTRIPWISDDGAEKGNLSVPPTSVPESSSTASERGSSSLVTDDDLHHLYRLVEEKDGGPAWIQMMDRCTPTMTYQAWRRDPETGPPQYRSRTVFEDATPELVRDFFWDDEFRSKWDDMLIHASTLETCPATGCMMVQWIRKFPFFCSDREYIIGRRIWESGRLYYCITKGVPCSTIPRRSKPRRVDLYYSSWCIRAVESKRVEGQLAACEVLLFHHEDMGIPWEIAKLGVRQGMWGAVKKIEPGLRAYQRERASEARLSPSALVAQMNIKISEDYLRSLGGVDARRSDVEDGGSGSSSDEQSGKIIPKLIVVGGAIALACTLDRGLITKAVIFGVARRFSKMGRRL